MINNNTLPSPIEFHTFQRSIGHHGRCSRTVEQQCNLPWNMFRNKTLIMDYRMVMGVVDPRRNFEQIFLMFFKMFFSALLFDSTEWPESKRHDFEQTLRPTLTENIINLYITLIAIEFSTMLFRFVTICLLVKFVEVSKFLCRDLVKELKLVISIYKSIASHHHHFYLAFSACV